MSISEPGQVVRVLRVCRRIGCQLHIGARNATTASASHARSVQRRNEWNTQNLMNTSNAAK